MRKVEYSEYVKVGNPDCLKMQVVGTAYFHEWGCDFEYLEGGAGNYSTAILELENGEIKNIPAENIRFLDKLASTEEK